MQRNLSSPALALVLALVSSSAIALIAGCGHKPQVAYTPPPPVLAPPPPVATAPTAPSSAPTATPPLPGAEPEASADEEFVQTHQPLSSETGTASWYGPPYHNRQGANGKIFNQYQISAAHRTLPMGSLIRVTNLKTGQSQVMRVTDRGPFVPGRTIDLSEAAAKTVGVWLPGTATVRIDVYETPKPMAEGGRWCVQIGAFTHEKEALRLQEHLERQFQTANVIEFTGPTGHWVRIRPANDDRERAIEIAQELKPSEGEAYLVRLD